ncbi:Putative sugar transferase [Nitrosotalea devaniterrae]|uniref:Sugar transferase n=1 Tax=Nitrosotalea devaniterrae TaxID=1078905 RepID=A0A128A630_9ARCH|nr:Putative sugar transferase [Candidatus Nitrosotalea devanaterra]
MKLSCTPWSPIQQIIIIFILSTIGIISTIIYFSMNTSFSFLVKTTDEHYDISGWATLVVSTGIGIAIAIAILIYTDTQQSRINDIILEQNESKKNRGKFVIKKMHLDLQLLKRKLIDIGTIYAVENTIPATAKDSYEQEVKLLEMSLSVLINDMQKFAYEFGDVIPHDILEDALKIYEPLRKYYIFAEKGKIARLETKGFVDATENLLVKLDKMI